MKDGFQVHGSAPWYPSPLYRRSFSAASLAALRALLAEDPPIPERALARCVDTVRGDVPGERDGMGALTLDACRSDPGETAGNFEARATGQMAKLRESWPGLLDGGGTGA